MKKAVGFMYGSQIKEVSNNLRLDSDAPKAARQARVVVLKGCA
jgi:hypothetical protein